MTNVSMQSAPKNDPSPPANGEQKATTSASMVLGSDAYRGALEPTSVAQAWDVASMMASIGFCGVTSAPEALGRIMTGRGLGLSAMQSMRGVYTVNGRPGIDAALMQALCLQSPLCEYFRLVSEESDETKATYVTKRVGNPEVKHTFTIEDAEKMGVVDRGDNDKAKKDNNWTKVRKAMLRARAKSELARIEFPDIIFGMYSREELEAGELPNDPNEMVVDIVAREEAEAERSQMPRPSTVQAAPRDYAAEAAALKEKIAAATTRQARAEVRQAFEAWDGIEPYRTQVQEAYNATRKGAAAPAADASAQPNLMPEGNLFEQPKDGAK